MSSAWRSLDLAPVSAFCDARGLRHHAEIAIRLAREAFPDAKRVTVSAENEADPFAACLVIVVATGLGPRESVRQHERFVRQWIVAAPPEIVERISLTLDLT